MVRRLWLCFVLLAALAQAQAPDQLKLVVVLSRHGVRAPLSLMTGTSQRPWPDIHSDWHVPCCGDLTPRGAELVERMGAYYRLYYVRKGLLPAGCPAKNVSIWADNEERTIRTAESLAKGLSVNLPNCQITPDSLQYKLVNCDQSGAKECVRPPQGVIDLWFHPLPALWNKVSTQEKDEINEVADNINKNYDQLFSKYRVPLQDLQNTLGCCHRCQIKPHCDLFGSDHTARSGAPTAQDPKGAGTAIKWGGPFASGSTASEVFLLEYGNHMPCEKVGWGRVIFDSPHCTGPGHKFGAMQVVHTEYFQQVQRPPVAARIQGSNLTYQILAKLEAAASSPTAPDERLFIISGHDTNIANVAALLGLQWNLSPDYPKNDTPPAGALVFELYSGSTPGNHTVKMYYTYQKLEQLRTNAELTLKSPPGRRDLAMDACKQPCKLDVFKSLVQQLIDPNLVTKTHRGN